MIKSGAIEAAACDGSVHHEVFICHASEDKPIADGVCAILEQSRVPCWIAPRDILPAQDYGQAIVESISSSRLVVFVFSTSANASPHIRRELECAVSHGIPILPFRIEDTVPSESLQYYLGGIHWLDALTPPLEAHLRHLAGTVKVLLERDDQTPSGNRAPAAPPPPRTGDTTRPDGSRGSRRAWLIGLGALVVIGVLVGVVVALGGGGGGGGGSTTTSSQAAVTEEMATAQKSCDLLDAADVKAVFGPSANPGTPNGNDGYCDFAASESVKVTQEAATAGDLASGRPLAATGVVDLPDVGGGAYQEPSGTLTVFDAKRAIIFVMITGGSGPADYQRLVDLAKRVVDRG